MSVTVIAEAGVNHNGDLEIAKSLIDAAVHAQADIVKFQTFSADRLVSRNAPKAQYQKENMTNEESQFSMLKKLELSEESHHDLIKYCKLQKIEFLSTGFDIQSLDFLNNINQNMFKIPSGEITNLPYLRHLGKIGKPIILSTGMSTLKEIEEALNVLEISGTPRNKITVLHCTSAYPAPKKDVNLKAMNTILKEFNVAVGYSDHTLGIEISIAAVALGATVIEKHFTLDRNLPGPDHKASLEPNELKELVSAIRNIEVALGDGIKRVMPSEAENLAVIRKSLIASRVIKKGETFNYDNLSIKRPGVGISPMKFDEILGQTSKRNYAENEIIEQ
jgi:N,N'-diacetyllegionaminate synthase